MMVLLLSMVCGSISVSKPASAKSVSKITKVITETNKMYGAVHKLSIKKNEKVFTRIEILDVKGKVSSSRGLEFGHTTLNMDGLFDRNSSPSKLKKSSFKKGEILTSKKNYLHGRVIIEWNLPDGIEKLKVKVTYYTKSGKAGIKSLKQIYY